MVLCVNTSLGMGKGKIGAQCAHAAVGVLQKFARRCGDAFAQWEMSGQPKITVKVKDEGEMVRGVVVIACAVDFCALCVCVCCVFGRRAPPDRRGVFAPSRSSTQKQKHSPHTPTQSTHTQAALAEKAAALGLPWYIVHDAGRTQIAAGSQTVLAVGPGVASQVNLVTGGLGLL